MASSSQSNEDDDFSRYIKPLFMRDVGEKGDLLKAREKMVLGNNIFRVGNCSAAARNFSAALKFMNKIYGRVHIECANVYYMLGMAELYDIPFSEEDTKLAVTAIEADGYILIDDSIENAFKFKTGENPEIFKFSMPWINLRYAITCANKEVGYTWLKAKVLSALGEAAYRKGDGNAYMFYKEASKNIDALAGETDIRNIILKLKVGLCVEKNSITEAIEVHYEGLLLCENRGKFLEEQGFEKEEIEKQRELLIKIRGLIKGQITRLENAYYAEKSKKNKSRGVTSRENVRAYQEKIANPKEKSRFQSDLGVCLIKGAYADMHEK